MAGYVLNDDGSLPSNRSSMIFRDDRRKRKGSKKGRGSKNTAGFSTDELSSEFRNQPEFQPHHMIEASNAQSNHQESLPLGYPASRANWISPPNLTSNWKTSGYGNWFKSPGMASPAAGFLSPTYNRGPINGIPPYSINNVPALPGTPLHYLQSALNFAASRNSPLQGRALGMNERVNKSNLCRCIICGYIAENLQNLSQHLALEHSFERSTPKNPSANLFDRNELSKYGNANKNVEEKPFGPEFSNAVHTKTNILRESPEDERAKYHRSVNGSRDERFGKASISNQESIAMLDTFCRKAVDEDFKGRQAYKHSSSNGSDRKYTECSTELVHNSPNIPHSYDQTGYLNAGTESSSANHKKFPSSHSEYSGIKSDYEPWDLSAKPTSETIDNIPRNGAAKREYKNETVFVGDLELQEEDKTVFAEPAKKSRRKGVAYKLAGTIFESPDGNCYNEPLDRQPIDEENKRSLHQNSSFGDQNENDINGNSQQGNNHDDIKNGSGSELVDGIGELIPANTRSTVVKCLVALFDKKCKSISNASSGRNRLNGQAKNVESSPINFRSHSADLLLENGEKTLEKFEQFGSKLKKNHNIHRPNSADPFYKSINSRSENSHNFTPVDAIENIDKNQEPAYNKSGNDKWDPAKDESNSETETPKKVWKNGKNSADMDVLDNVCIHCCITFPEKIMHQLHMSFHQESTSNDHPFQCAQCHERCADRTEFYLHIARAAHA